MFPQRAAHAYSQVGLETGVAVGSPHALIIMLYEGAIRWIAEATKALAAGETAAKGEAVSRAIAIIENGLKASLDRERGGAIAGQLGDLYDYMTRRLLLGSLRQERQPFDEVVSLLRELRDTWASIDPAASAMNESPVAVQV